MSIWMILLAIAVVVSWVIAIRTLNKEQQGNKATNTMIVAAVLTTLFVMLLFLGRG